MRGGWEAINRGDYEAMLQLMAEDIEFRSPAYLVDGISYRGHSGMREWYGRAMESWSRLHGTPRAMANRATGSRSRSIWGWSAAPATSRVRTAFVVYTIRAGKVLSVEPYASEGEAIEAVERGDDGA